MKAWIKMNKVVIFGASAMAMSHAGLNHHSSMEARWARRLVYAVLVLLELLLLVSA